MRECPKCELCFDDEALICPTDSVETRFTMPGSQQLAGRYMLKSLLGKGAMGRVYLAQDNNLGTRSVAVKTVRQDLLNSDDLQEGEAIARFEREAMSAASIRHPHVVDVTDFGKTADGIFYLVMEYVEGETLHKLLRREGTLNVKRAVGLLKQISEGVEAAHDAGILHRDLKPANIFIMQKKSNTTDDGFIKVGDFGLAKIVNQTVTDTSSNATPSSRGIIGTPEYMSPEQMQPELGVDVRSDLYALGTIAYLMLGGKTPFTGDLMQLVMQKIMQTPPLISTLRTDIPKSVERLIMQAIERDAVDRPATVGVWMSELIKASEELSDNKNTGNSRLIIMAPIAAEVYVDDERKGSIGSSGRLILSGIPVGRHILRVSKLGERDDERVIEIREEGSEQVIQAQLRAIPTQSQPSPSVGSGHAESSVLPDIVACTKCKSRFAGGVKFCGRCGNSQFEFVTTSSNQEQKMFPCPKCATSLPQYSKFCGRCGLDLVTKTLQPQIIPKAVERVCQTCRTSYPASTRFCGKCGNSLS
jgi:serine/threonine protein kinase